MTRSASRSPSPHRGSRCLGVVVFLLLSLTPGRSPAQSNVCAGATTTAAMRNCEDQRYTQAAENLNTVYNQLLRQSSPAARSLLVASQTAWLRFREANAAFAAGAAAGGTMAPLLKVTTLADMTETRILELKKHLP